MHEERSTSLTCGIPHNALNSLGKEACDSFILKKKTCCIFYVTMSLPPKHSALLGRDEALKGKLSHIVTLAYGPKLC